MLTVYQKAILGGGAVSPSQWDVWIDMDHNVTLDGSNVSTVGNQSSRFPSAILSGFGADTRPPLTASWRNGRNAWTPVPDISTFIKGLDTPTDNLPNWPTLNGAGTFSMALVTEMVKIPSPDSVWRYAAFIGRATTVGQYETTPFYIQGSTGNLRQFSGLNGTSVVGNDYIARASLPADGTPVIMVGQFGAAGGGRIQIWPHGSAKVTLNLADVGECKENTPPLGATNGWAWGGRRSSPLTDAWFKPHAAFTFSVGLVSNALADATANHLSNYYNIVPL